MDHLDRMAEMDVESLAFDYKDQQQVEDLVNMELVAAVGAAAVVVAVVIPVAVIEEFDLEKIRMNEVCQVA